MIISERLTLNGKEFDMQRLDLDKDGKLVLYTDNGCTDGVNSSVKIDGEFTVSANVAKVILASHNNHPIYLRVWETIDYGLCQEKQIICDIITDEYVDNMRREYQTEIKRLEKEEINLRKRLRELEAKVTEFNNSRYFFERKFKYE